MQDAGKPLRLFIALWPGEALRRAISSWQHAWSWPPRAALVKPDRLHLTLHFLGDVPASRLPQLVGGLKTRVEPFTLALGQAEVWPNGVALLRPDTTPTALAWLQAALRRDLEALELPVETRPYRAHVTLARRAHGAIPPQQGPGLRWGVDSGYVLVRSLAGGAGYDVLACLN
jgi:2'-5' RNA ligase